MGQRGIELLGEGGGGHFLRGAFGEGWFFGEGCWGGEAVGEGVGAGVGGLGFHGSSSLFKSCGF